MENVMMTEPELSLFFDDYDRRVIWIDNEIDKNTIQIIRYIMNWNFEDKDIVEEKRMPIKLCICSNGGNLDIMNSLIDVIELSKTPIYGYNMGYCLSAAAFIFLACHRRFSLKNSWFLFHRGSGGFDGSFDDVKNNFYHYQNQINEIQVYISEKTSYDFLEVKEKMEHDWYINAREALKNKVCDTIMTDIDFFN